MEFESMLGRMTDLMPSAWSDGAKLAVVAAVIAVCFVVPVAMMFAAFGKKRAPKAPAAKPVAGLAAAAGTVARIAARTPDLDPEEWVSGDVIHFDRQKSFGYIRCDRVKGHVRFQAEDFRRVPRVGETVRFKGRHGARRKPVALVVERLQGTKRAG